MTMERPIGKRIGGAVTSFWKKTVSSIEKKIKKPGAPEKRKGSLVLEPTEKEIDLPQNRNRAMSMNEPSPVKSPASPDEHPFEPIKEEVDRESTGKEDTWVELRREISDSVKECVSRASVSHFKICSFCEETPLQGTIF